MDSMSRSTPACRTGLSLSGGLSLGRQRTNNCYAIDDRSLLFVATSPRTDPFCDVHPPMQPNVKLQAVYPLPWWGIQTSATFQSLPGPQILAQQQTTNAQILPSLGRNLASCGAAAVCNDTVLLDLLPPGTHVRRPVYQVDVRFNKTITVGPDRHSSDGVRLQPPQREPGALVQQPLRSIVASSDGHSDRAIRGRWGAGGFLMRTIRRDRRVSVLSR